jgi:hypothetical protein
MLSSRPRSALTDASAMKCRPQWPSRRLAEPGSGTLPTIGSGLIAPALVPGWRQSIGRVNRFIGSSPASVVPATGLGGSHSVAKPRSAWIPRDLTRAAVCRIGAPPSLVQLPSPAPIGLANDPPLRATPGTGRLCRPYRMPLVADTPCGVPALLRCYAGWSGLVCL